MEVGVQVMQATLCNNPVNNVQVLITIQARGLLTVLTPAQCLRDGISCSLAGRI